MKISDMTILVTGAAGFIGFHLARRLLEQGRPVVGLDNLNDYYDVAPQGGAARASSSGSRASVSSAWI